MIEKDGNEFGKRLKHLREIHKLSQTDLAERLGVSTQVISNWERNYTSPDLGNLQKLLVVFELSADFLLGLQGKNSKRQMDIYEKEETDLHKKIINKVKLIKNYKDQKFLLEILERLIN